MAIITFGPITAQALGTIGGTVFAASCFGPYVRTKASAVQPQTSAQLATRAAFTATAKTFSTKLTPAQIATWQALALANAITNRFGLARTLTAQQWFVKLNHNLKQIGQPEELNAPANLFINSPSGLSLVEQTSPSVALILTTDSAPGAGIYTLISASPPVTTGRIRPSVRSVVIAIAPPSQAPPYDITTAYKDRYGSAAAPALIHARAKFINAANGVSGRALAASTIITANL